MAAARECRHLTSTQAPGKHALQCAALEPRVRSELGCDCNLTAGLPVTGADLHNRLKLLPMPLIRLHPVKDSGAAPAASCSVQLLEAVLGGGGGAAWRRAARSGWGRRWGGSGSGWVGVWGWVGVGGDLEVGLSFGVALH